MAAYSSDEYYNKHSPSKAFVLGELKEAKRTITQKDEAITQQAEAIRHLEERLQSLEVQQARPSLILTMVHGILIDLHQEALPMIMDVKKNIEEGDLTPNFMAIDHLMLMKINMKMAITVMQRQSYFR